jgi:sporadic carbohydrate cluster protein (TIGR04323 family)
MDLMSYSKKKISNFISYIQNKKFGDYYLPARYQYVILRDYYKKFDKSFILPQGEPVFTKTAIRLRSIIKKMKNYDSLILLSAYMLPDDGEIRLKILKLLSKKKIELHCIFENIIAKNQNELRAINDLIKLSKFTKS